MATFENILIEINDFGKYQKLRYGLICIAAILPALVTYIHSFTSPNADHRCKNPYDPSDAFNKNPLANFTNITSLNKCTIQYSGIKDNSSITEVCREWVYDKTYYHTTLTEDWSMVCDRSILRGAVQTVYFMGYLIGSIFIGVLADIYGRKPLMLTTLVMIIVGSFGTALGPRLPISVSASYVIYAISRFLIACGTRGINVTGFVLGMEMMGKEKRTFAGIFFEYFFAIGQLILVVITYFVRDWETVSLIIAIMTLPFVSYFFMLPESPRWLLTKRRDDDALEIIKNVARVNKRSLNMDTWNKFLEVEKTEEKDVEKETLVDTFKSPKIMFISMILYLNWIINNLVFYGVGLKSNDLGVSPYLSFTISAIVELLAIAFTHAILDKLGRKLPYCGLLFLAGVSCLSIIFIEKVEYELALAMLGKFCASGSYAIIYLYSSELFPTSIRNSCMGACSMMARIGSMTAPLVINISDWKDFPFLIFGIAGIIGSLSAVILPESLNRELPESIKDFEKTSPIGLSCRYSQTKESGNEEEIVELQDRLKQNDGLQ